MIKKISCFVSLFISVCAYSQEKNISEVKAPGSPASVIIGNSPSAIERPKSFEALEASLFKGYSDNNGGLIIPNDLAIEFSPYWASNKLNLDNSSYLTPTGWETLKQNFSISISNTQNFVIQDSVNTNAIGIGIRTMLLSGHKDSDTKILKKVNGIKRDLNISTKVSAAINNIACNQCTKSDYVTQIINNLKNQNQLDLEIINHIKDLIDEELTFNPDNMDFNSDAIDDLIDKHFNIDNKVDDITYLRANRKGFKLEIAAALGIDFPTNEMDSSVVPKFGFWLTPSYEPYKIEWLEFLGVIRIFRYNDDFYEEAFPTEEVYRWTVDYGVRLVIKKRKFSLELEGIGRSGKTVISEIINQSGNIVTESKNTDEFQWVFNFNYQINERLILSYNFGKGFDPVILNSQGDLISLATLNFGLGGPTKNDLK